MVPVKKTRAKGETGQYGAYVPLGLGKERDRPNQRFYPRLAARATLGMDDLAALSSGNIGDDRGQDARNVGSSGPSSNENNTCMISFVLILPFMSLSATTSC
jgi:hypothetical protein